MKNREIAEEGLALLSVAIGVIMEDHVDAAVMALPPGNQDRWQHFMRLRQAGSDIVALAEAAEAMLRLSAEPR